MRRTVAPVLVALLTMSPLSAQQPPDAALVARARAIHERVITLDTHDDINPRDFTTERNYTQRLENQVNLPKMKEGGLDASFFIVYVGQGPLTAEGYADAYRQAIEKFDAIHRLAEQIAPDQIGLALSAADVRRIAASGRKVALIGIENAYPVGIDLSRVKEFHDRGGRYMSLAHNGHNQFADSNTGERDGKWLHNGLSEAGRQVIIEMNRWGIMVDVSHPSKQANLQAMALSRAPVIASHSAARALADHSRNMDDEQLLALKKNGGVIQTVAFDGYVKIKPPNSPERTAALASLRTEFGLPPAGGGGGGGGGQAAMTEARRKEFAARMAQLDASFPPPPMATVGDFVDHIDYLVKKIGVDHVGISSDFDGGGGVKGWNGAEETFNVTLELVRRGYSEEQIGKIWSGNLLRVMDEVQRAATQQPAPPPKGAMPNLGRPTQATDEVPPLDFDGYFTGAWDFEWTVPESALGPAGPVSGITTYRSLGNSVFEAESKAEGPNGPYIVKERIEYQKDKKLVTRRVNDSRGFTYTSKATVAGDLGGIYYLLFESEPFKAGGKTVRLKENVRLLSPFNYRVAFTLSEDGGEFANYGNPWWRKQAK